MGSGQKLASQLPKADTVDCTVGESSQSSIQHEHGIGSHLQSLHESRDHDEPTERPTPEARAPTTKPTSLPTSADELPAAIGPEIPQSRVESNPLSWSMTSDRHLGHGRSASLNADPSDRVFPIRSVVSVDQSQPTPRAAARNPGDFDFPRQETTWDGRRRSSNPHVLAEMTRGFSGTENVSAFDSPSPWSPNGKDGTAKARRKSTLSHIVARPTANKERLAAGSPPLFNDGCSDTSDRIMEDGSLSTGGSQTPESYGSRTPDLNESLVTVRFRYAVTDEGHAVITGRDGTLQRCEDEPIHAPGAVQAFGLLIALREETDGRFSVRYVSENSKRLIGYSPRELFRLRSFTEIFTEEQADNLLDHIDFIRDEESDPSADGPDVFSISIRPPKRRPLKLWCAIHINDSHPDLIICEFELEDDQEHPLRPPEELIPDEPEDTLYQKPTMEEFHESTEINSRPLRVLRSARKRRGEAGAMQVFDIMSQVQEQLASATNLEKFLKILVGIVKELTGFHRVMIYQFDSEFNGKVVTELVDPTHTRDLYHGLHFPASDIPKQARELYKLNKVRLLYDRDLQSARLVCRSTEDLEQPLDLSHAYLRAMSPIHLKYLANMAVRSSMSISVNAFGELWGLVACHGYGSKGMRVPFPIRKMCRLVGDTASRNIERLSYASRLQARKLINTMPTDKNPSGYIIASSDDLLRLFDADFGMLSIRGETKILGKIEQSQEALAMLEYLRLRSFTSVLTSQGITEDFPDLRYLPGFVVIAGLLYVPLSVGGNDFIVFFRKGQIRDVKWAGNPNEKVIREGTTNYLEPRSSFKVWHETVVGKCREWTEEQVETAAVLCLVYGKFIEVWRQKEAALQSSRLTRLLLANSAHEVRTPLNAIINYLEIALEGSLDSETRENLARSHSASKSLIYVINDLLDLTKTEEGQELIKDEILDLSACIREATEPFKLDAKRKSLAYEIIEHPGLPQYVHGDYRRVRQVVANMTANAMQHTAEGSVRVESYVTEVIDSRVWVEIMVHDTGRGMSNEKLDSLFQDLEQVSAYMDDPTSVEEEPEQLRENRTLGLGLAVVARIVRNMDGQLRLKSEEGKGSRFVIQLPFELPTDDCMEKTGANEDTAKSAANTSFISVTKTMPPADAGEVMLVYRGSSSSVNVPPREIAEKRSFEETNSVSSLKSGGSNSARSTRSDADRLIDAIQMPLSLGDPDEESCSIQRRNSKGHLYKPSASATSLPGLDTTHPPPSNAGGPLRPTLQRSTPSPPNMSFENCRPGSHYVTDSKTPIKPIKIADEYFDRSKAPQIAQESKILFELSDKSEQGKQSPEPATQNQTSNLHVLVAEDDPINMKILKKRLEKIGCKVDHAVNGEDCATIYKENPTTFDVILMDMQMPIADGLTSTKMIREFENQDKRTGLSPVAESHRRVPIFAVSASLVERDRHTYVKAGFDGWILKPIDFKRLNVLLDGITNDKVRDECLYEHGAWERGGWFASRPYKWHDSLRPERDANPPSGGITPTGQSQTPAEPPAT